MAIRLTKKSKVVFAISIILLSSVLGYFVWRVNQPDTVAPTDSEAGGGTELPPGTIPGPPVEGGVEIICTCCDYNSSTNMTKVTVSVSTVSEQIEKCREACTEYDGWRGDSDNNCGVPLDACYCEINSRIGNSCGYNCHFPDGTQATVNSEAEKTCTPKIAMCYGKLIPIEEGSSKFRLETEIKIENYTSSHICYGLTDQCKNPYAPDPCKQVEPMCGDGNIDDGESCDPKATPNGCATGETCENDCTCSPPGRPSLCKTTTISSSTLSDGQSVTMTSETNGSLADYYTYAVYNTDNPYSPGNPKPVCVPGTVSWSNNCPTGTQPLIFKDLDTTTARTKGSVTFSAEDIFVNDAFWDNQKVRNVSITAYFSLKGGLTSLPDDNCKEVLTYLTPDQPTPPPAGETVPQTALFDSTLERISVGFVLLVVGFFVYNLPSYYFIRKPKKVDYTYREKFEKKMSK